jgi:hypothetical protein
MFFPLWPINSLHIYDTIPTPLRILQKHRILCRPSNSVPVLIDKAQQHACQHNILVTIFIGGTQWRSWLRHCATSRKVTGSIPDGVIGIFYWHNPSGRTMALGLTQPLTEISTRNISWGYRRPLRRADNLTTLKYRLSWNLGASTSWNPQDLSRPVMVF